MAITSKFQNALGPGLKKAFEQEYDEANLKYKIKERYTTGWTDPRIITLSMQMTEEDLNHEAYNTPIATLQNLWLARFGSVWVDTNNLNEDLFFIIVAQRLLSAGRMDRADMVDGERAVRLIPE